MIVESVPPRLRERRRALRKRSAMTAIDIVRKAGPHAGARRRRAPATPTKKEKRRRFRTFLSGFEAPAFFYN